MEVDAGTDARTWAEIGLDVVVSAAVVGRLVLAWTDADVVGRCAPTVGASLADALLALALGLASEASVQSSGQSESWSEDKQPAYRRRHLDTPR